MSPSGRYLAFEYDAGGRISRATDDRGRRMSYAYDAGGRLATSTDSAEGIVRYLYDGLYMVSAQEVSGGELFHVEYVDGRVATLRMADGRKFRFAFKFSDPMDGPSQATVVAPDGAITRIDVPGDRPSTSRE